MLDIAQLCKANCHKKKLFEADKAAWHIKTANMHKFKLRLAYFQCQCKLQFL